MAGTKRTNRGPWVMPDGSVNWRAPAEPGNKLAVRHGATSPSIMDRRAAEVLTELVDVMPWLSECDAVLVESLTRSLAQFRALDAYVSAVITGEAESYPRKGQPRTGVEGVPPTIYEQWARAQRAVESSASKLGMAPSERSKIFRDTGYARVLAMKEAQGDLASLRQTGRALREATA